MDILNLEKKASALRIDLLKNKLPRHKLFLIYSFFQILLNEKEKNIIESYLLEFLDTYSGYLSSLDIAGINPTLTEKVLIQAEVITEKFLDQESKTNLKISAINFKKKYIKLIDILNGKENIIIKQEITFPLLEKDGVLLEEGNYGLLGSVSVQFKSNPTENRFHIIPGIVDTDTLLKNQIELALKNALRIASGYTKIKNRFWDIYIDFDIKTAEYCGNSFGLILVLKIVGELLRFYDAPIKIVSIAQTGLTGSIDESGNIKKLNKEIIQQKVKTVFFSNVNLFVVPEDDLTDAKEIIQLLLKNYPERRLKIIGIPTIEDLFNLRNVIEIKRENRILRTGKFIKKHSFSSILLILLALLVFFSGLWDFDNNPVMYDINKRIIKIENKNGKELWSFECIENTMAGLNGAVPNIALKFYDIDNDGINEVLLCREKLTTRDPNYGRIICYNNKKEKQWQYIFRDTVFTPEYRHTNFFTSNIIDIVDEKNKQILYAFADNDPLYPSAIYKLNVKNGQRIDSSNVLWNSGGIFSAIIGNSNYATKREVVAIALNNGYERSVLFAINTDKLNGRSPAPRIIQSLIRSLLNLINIFCCRRAI